MSHNSVVVVSFLTQKITAVAICQIKGDAWKNITRLCDTSRWVIWINDVKQRSNITQLLLLLVRYYNKEVNKGNKNKPQDGLKQNKENNKSLAEMFIKDYCHRICVWSQFGRNSLASQYASTRSPNKHIIFACNWWSVVVAVLHKFWMVVLVAHINSLEKNPLQLCWHGVGFVLKYTVWKG